jgi:hypothetical protein
MMSLKGASKSWSTGGERTANRSIPDDTYPQAHHSTEDRYAIDKMLMLSSLE